MTHNEGWQLVQRLYHFAPRRFALDVGLLLAGMTNGFDLDPQIDTMAPLLCTGAPEAPDDV